MAREYGEPLWCVGTGMRNSHQRAVAPTVSNSKLSGNVSAGIEPWAANVFTEQTAKGTFIRKNPSLEKVLEKLGYDTKETWDQILSDGGSVQDLEFMDNYRVKLGETGNPITLSKFNKLPEIDQSTYIPLKDVYLTFKELNQLELVRQAGIRQQYIDQSVSLNLAFPTEAEPKFINQVHLEAYQSGIKTLYYMRTESVLRGDISARAMVDCLSCDG
jgi:ribonucleoside-diphosphate reductase alpha chain